MKTLKFLNLFSFLILGCLIFSSCGKDTELQEVVNASAEPTVQAKALAPPNTCPGTIQIITPNPSSALWQLDIERTSCTDNSSVVNVASYNHLNTDLGEIKTLQMDHDHSYYFLLTTDGASLEIIYTDPQGNSHNLVINDSTADPINLTTVHVLCPGIEWLLC